MSEHASTMNGRGIAKQVTGIPGFDHLSDGGLPEGRTTLVCGTAGSAKTVLACQFLAAAIRDRGESGVFVTFEESPDDIRRNMHSFGWNIPAWEAEGLWAFVDASLHPEHENLELPNYDLGAFLARMEYAVGRVGARRVVLDSLGAVFSQFSDSAIIRRELHRAAMALRRMGVTAILTAERTEEYGPISRYGVEEFVADNVIILRQALEDEKRRRTLEILKFRGTTHQKGEYPFTVVPAEGLAVLPLSAGGLKQRSSNVRVTSGIEALDEMCGGGFFRDSIILVSGATGTGKTLLTTQFIAGGAARGERCLLFAFEESHDQLHRNALGWGMDFEAMESDGLLQINCAYPETSGLEDHLVRIRKAIDEYQPDRVAIDSLSAMERVSTPKGFREFVIGITSHVKEKEVPGLSTSTSPSLMGGQSVTEAHISTITDSIILLRYVEMFGEMQRGITVLKMRGSPHDKEIHRFSIDGAGMHIREPFRNVLGILSGNPVHIPQSELDRIGSLFEEG